MTFLFSDLPIKTQKTLFSPDSNPILIILIIDLVYSMKELLYISIIDQTQLLFLLSHEQTYQLSIQIKEYNPQSESLIILFIQQVKTIVNTLHRGSPDQQYNIKPRKGMNSLDSRNSTHSFSPIFSYGPILPQASPLFTAKNNSLFFYSVIAPSTFETLRNIEQLDSCSFETRIESSIIIQGLSDLSSHRQTQTKKKEFQASSSKVGKKIPQKDSRNVSSNLLRIFLKNLIELKIFDALIQQIIPSHNFSITPEEFHTWLNSFRINFKNYIRFKEVRLLYRDQKNPHMSSIFRTILRHYTNSLGITHILTSRRIERRSLLMHLNGLRYLSNQLYNL